MDPAECAGRTSGMNWQTLGTPSPRDLTPARLALHHALQLPSLAVGKRFVPPADDDSHTALDWRSDTEQWTSQPIPGTDGVRAGLCPGEMTLTVGRESAPATRSLHLPGISREGALAWLGDALGAEGVEVSDPAHDALTIDAHYDLPAHPVADRGDTWRTDLLAGTREIGRYFTNADSLLVDVAADHADATPILTWPHHFDIARLLPAGPAESPLDRSVGIGMSAGDDSYDEPYFYVNASPRSKSKKPAALSVGHWHTEGFFAAVLTATELLRTEAPSQSERARRFFAEAIDAAHALLD